MSVPSVLDRRYLNKNENFLSDVLEFHTKLSFKNSEVKLVGTGAMASQLYPADIDLLTIIQPIPKTANIVKKEYVRIFKDIEAKPKLFFIEFKLQNKDGSKHKFFNKEDVKGNFFYDYYNPSTIQMCKIDLLLFTKGYFKEVSCVYFFGEEFDQQKYIYDILKDQKEYYEEGKYYKSLKRFMLACKLQDPPNTNVIIGITNFFNSENGRLYQLNNHIAACIIYMDKFGIDDRVRMFIKNIGLGDLDPSKLKNISNDYAKIYNDEALKFYKHFNIPVGKLMPFQKKRLGGKKGAGFGDMFLTGLTAPFTLASKVYKPFGFGVDEVAKALKVKPITEL